MQSVYLRGGTSLLHRVYPFQEEHSATHCHSISPAPFCCSCLIGLKDSCAHNRVSSSLRDVIDHRAFLHSSSQDAFRDCMYVIFTRYYDESGAGFALFDSKSDSATTS